MAKAYSREWFAMNGLLQGWTLLDDKKEDLVLLGFYKPGLPALALTWLEDKFYVGGIRADGLTLSMGQRRAAEYLADPAAVINTIKAEREAGKVDVHAMHPSRSTRTGSVSCCGFSWVVQRGHTIAACKKCLREIEPEEVS